MLHGKMLIISCASASHSSKPFSNVDDERISLRPNCFAQQAAVERAVNGELLVQGLGPRDVTILG